MKQFPPGFFPHNGLDRSSINPDEWVAVIYNNGFLDFNKFGLIPWTKVAAYKTVEKPNVDPPKSLRDEFAMAAMQGDFASDPNGIRSFEYVALRAYQFADAMLAQRKK